MKLGLYKQGSKYLIKVGLEFWQTKCCKQLKDLTFCVADILWVRTVPRQLPLCVTFHCKAWETALEIWLLFSLSIRLLRWNSFLSDPDPIIVLPCPQVRPLWCWCRCWWYCRCWGSVVVVRYACQKSRSPCLLYVLSKGPSNVTVKSLCPPDPQNVHLDLLQHSRSPKLPNKSEDQSNLPIDPLDSLGPPWPPETPYSSP